MRTIRWVAVALAGMLALLGGTVQAQDVKSPVASDAPKTVTPRSYASPEAAVQALVAAVRAGSVQELLAVIGRQSRSWLFSGDKVADAAEWQRFLAAFDRKHTIVKTSAMEATLLAGEDDWPFPAPLVADTAGKWSFDAEAGRQEVLNRRVGRNELDTIQTLLAMVDAQREYAANDTDGNGLHDYAARFMSSPGRKDGLYWPTQPGEPASPLGVLAAKAFAEGYGLKGRTGSNPVPYHGYYFRILTAQGKDAPGGAYSYTVNGKMFGGFAIVAWPASYGSSGVKTFMVNHDAVVWERDLGPATASTVAKLRNFNPGKGWTRVPQN